MTRKKSPKDASEIKAGNTQNVAIWIALIGLVGTLVTAYLNYRASIGSTELIIYATKTAQAIASLSIQSQISLTPSPFSVATTSSTNTTLMPTSYLNTPTSIYGGSVVINSSNSGRQSFILPTNILKSVDVYLSCGNPGNGDDNITMRILTKDGEHIITRSQYVLDGFKGWLHFDFTNDGLNLTQGQKLIIELQAEKITFLWDYRSDNYYSEGKASSRLLDFLDEIDNIDFIFRINE